MNKSGEKEWMTQVLVVVSAKVNLFLRLLETCQSGYHLVETQYHSIDLRDEVFLKRNDGGLTLEIEPKNHKQVPMGEENIVYRAAERFFKESGQEPSVDIRVRKFIPVGAGLGGGSADAAATLRGLNLLYGSPISEAMIYRLAGNLGADIPFLLYGGSSLAWGRGDRLAPLKTLSPLHVGICYPRFEISSRWAYEMADKGNGIHYPGASLISIEKLHRENWVLPHLQNDFEEIIFPRYPQLREIKEIFLERGAAGSILSGSGSSVFAVFGDRRKMQKALKQLEDSFDVDVYESSFVSQGIVIESPVRK